VDRKGFQIKAGSRAKNEGESQFVESFAYGRRAFVIARGFILSLYPSLLSRRWLAAQTTETLTIAFLSPFILKNHNKQNRSLLSVSFVVVTVLPKRAARSE